MTDVFQMKRKGIEFMAETVKEGNTPTFQASEVIFKLYVYIEVEYREKKSWVISTYC